MNPKADDLIKRLIQNSKESIRVKDMAAGTPGRLDLSFNVMQDANKINDDIQSIIRSGELTNKEKLQIIGVMAALKEIENKEDDHKRLSG